MASNEWMVIGLLMAVVGALSSRGQNKKWSAWKTAAQVLGLEYGKHQIRGTLDDCEVLVEVTKKSGDSSEKATRTSVRDRGRRIPHQLQLSREGFRSAVGKAFGGQDILTRDPYFDRMVRVQGQELEILALLDRRTRARLRPVIEAGAVVREGALVWETSGIVGDRGQLVQRVRGLVECTRALRLEPGEIPARLARNALEERGEVQLHNLRLLQQRFGRAEAAMDASRRLLGSDDARVRLQAAQHLEEEGLETVRALAGDESVQVPIRCQALRLLPGFGDPENALLLETALASRHITVRRTAAEALGKMRHRAARARLVELLEKAGDTESATIVTALGQIGDPECEPALVRCLQHDSVAVRIAAAKALGICGTVAAVEPLLPCTKGVLTDPDLKRAAAAAIQAIQARLGDVEAGRLSISDSSRDRGALSLAGDQGQLSYPESGRDAAAGEPQAVDEESASAGDTTAGNRGTDSGRESRPDPPDPASPEGKSWK